jgi:hypothetical protein
MEGEMIMMQDLYEFVRAETTTTGKITGKFQSTGIRSSYNQRLEVAGYKTDSKVIKAQAAR